MLGNIYMKTTRLAVFDIDGTIFRSSLVIELSHALVDAGVFPKTARKEIAKEYLAWVNRRGTYEAYINKVVRIYIKHIKGVRYTQVKRIAQSVINFQNIIVDTELEIKAGKFTGKVVNLDSAYNKAGIVKSIIKKYPSIILKKSLAVGDTEGDIAMLSLVGNPIAFNPNMELAKVAKQKGWRIVVERKDVV